jgi:hypothetical protein
MEEEKQIRIPTPGEKLSNILIDSLEVHQSYMRKVRTGCSNTEEAESISDNTRKMIQARSLIRVISSQRELITNARPIVYYQNNSDWLKEYKTSEEQTLHPFDKEVNSYYKLLKILSSLKYLVGCIREADRTTSTTDDFIVKNLDGSGGMVYDLTNNFYQMIEELENTYEKIYLILLKEGILTPLRKIADVRRKQNDFML